MASVSIQAAEWSLVGCTWGRWVRWGAGTRPVEAGGKPAPW